MELNLSPSDINQFLALAKRIEKDGGVSLYDLSDNVANLFKLSGEYLVSCNDEFYDIEKIA